MTDTDVARRSASVGGTRNTLVEGSRTRDVSWAEVADLPWDDFDLVLGAGGMTAASFEIGALLALSVDWGVDLCDFVPTEPSAGTKPVQPDSAAKSW
jgi:hypothetical protein